MRSLLLILTAGTACAAPPAAPPSAPAAAVSAPASAAPPSAPAAAVSAPASVAPPTTPLPLIVRRLLAGRMLRHGTDLGALDNAVKAGELKAVRVHARAIADEPRIARPEEGSATDTLNQAIPPAFYDLQDRLHQHAEALAAAAAAGDPARVRAAYDALGQTCGQCHRAWFPMPGE